MLLEDAVQNLTFSLSESVKVSTLSEDEVERMLAEQEDDDDDDDEVNAERGEENQKNHP